MPNIEKLDWSKLKPKTTELKYTHTLNDSGQFWRYKMNKPPVATNKKHGKVRTNKKHKVKAIDKSISEYHDNVLVNKFKQL